MLVLCFIVLITGLMLALLSRSASSELISNASANFACSDIYGRGAIDQVIGDLRQEIAAGSTVASANGSLASPAPVSTNANGYVVDIYRPSSPATAIPAEAGPSTYTASIWNTTFPNLLKESINGVPFYPSTSSYTSSLPASGRAAPVSSSNAGVAPNSISGVSRNGRFISLALWNEILLLPKSSSNSSVTDTTPDTRFVAPDWILTAVDGSNPTSAVLDTSTSLVTSNVNPHSPKFIVGRYAYAIYNEGGLLDANIAGSPAGYGGTGSTYPPATLSSTAPTNGGPSEQTIWSHKGPSSFADLTVLPGIADVTGITPEQVSDDIVGWRNNATAQAGSSTSSTSPSYILAGNSTGIDSYFSYLMGLTSNFMTACNLSGGTSDHIFTDRKQLISFLQALVPTTDTTDQGHLQDAMMYLGTFSRSLNQPSYWPDPTRPTVSQGPPVGNATTETNSTLTAATVGNNAFGKDNEYNPPFKSIRVRTSFVRPSGIANNDPTINPDGTTAVVGEPLVKKRFPLSRLIWLTYKGPSASVSTGDPLFQQYQLLYTGSSAGTPPPWLVQLWNEGTAANIENYFGLTWTAPPTTFPAGSPNYWVYNSTANGGHALINSGGVTIARLTEIATANREPDFFELLQAAICCGSLGTTAPQNLGGNFALYTSFWSQAKDSQIGLQVLQLGANIINQASPTSFPVHIVFSNANPPVSGSTYSIWGSTDLPYLSDVGNAAIAVADPIPGPAPNPSTAIIPANAQGVGAAFAVPTVWNPYASARIPTNQAFSPTALRIVVSDVSLEDPLVDSNLLLTAQGLAVMASGNINLTPYNNPEPWYFLGSYDSNTGTMIYPASGTLRDTGIYFKYDPTLYREPTPLMQEGTSANITIDAQNVINITGYNFVSNVQTGLTLPPWTGGIPELGTGKKFVGFLLGTYPLSQTIGGTTYNVNSLFPNAVPSLPGTPAGPYPGRTFSLEYQSQATGSAWVPYQQDERFTNFAQFYAVPYNATSGANTGSGPLLTSWPNQTPQAAMNGGGQAMGVCDPRTDRWGISVNTSFQPFADSTQTTTLTYRPAAAMDPTSSTDSDSLPIGAMTQNLTTTGSRTIADPDGVVRRAMGGYNTGTSLTTGLPMVTVAGTPANSSNRPIILHRPFRSVAELGYTFSDTPWKNIDFSSPESGYGALLDTFCINEDYRSDAVSAGKVDLNTRQAPVIQALLAGAYRDEEECMSSPPTTPAPDLTNTEAMNISQALVKRTTVGGTNPAVSLTGPQPLSNIADLVGRWVTGSSTAGTINGPSTYDGFSADLGASVYNTSGANNAGNAIIQRFRETTMRALSDAGQAGTWNLLIDLVAQSGRYPANATSLSDFQVQGQHHYWVHVAIDRQTGQVIDENIEPVNE